MRTPSRRLDLAKLEVFLEAARTGNYTVAAKRLHVTQSAVSHAIRKLEASLGHHLVEWRRRHFTLTGEGHYLLEVAERSGSWACRRPACPRRCASA
jgi:LysR family transcriptional regulator for metE and metH